MKEVLCYQKLPTIESLLPKLTPTDKSKHKKQKIDRHIRRIPPRQKHEYPLPVLLHVALHIFHHFEEGAVKMDV